MKQRAGAGDIKTFVKSSKGLKRFALWAARMVSPFGGLTVFSAVPGYLRFFVDWRRFVRAGGRADVLDFYPRLFDRTTTSVVDTHYFFQAVWAFRKLLSSRPRHHVDVGSQSGFVGLLSAITRVTFIDIRPLRAPLPELHSVAASIVRLPFADSSVESFSSLHVIEHVGLGRYGDPIDPAGSEKACHEIVRVLAAGGRAYVSVPIGRSRVQFNGQRVFDAWRVAEMFEGVDLRELSIVSPDGTFMADVDLHGIQISDHGQGLDYGLGMFEFAKPAR
jgi:SAM-dependent methyltransferase